MANSTQQKTEPLLEPNRVRCIAKSCYVVGALFWFLVWYLVGGFQYTFSEDGGYFPWLWAPFLFCLFVFIVNFWLVHNRPRYSNKINVEMDYIAFVERNGSYLVTAIFVTFLVVNAIGMVEFAFRLPPEFFFFQMTALATCVVGIFPLYWIPYDRPDWLAILRHLKTPFLNYSIFLFLGGLIILLDRLREMAV